MSSEKVPIQIVSMKVVEGKPTRIFFEMQVDPKDEMNVVDSLEQLYLGDLLYQKSFLLFEGVEFNKNENEDEDKNKGEDEDED